MVREKKTIISRERQTMKKVFDRIFRPSCFGTPYLECVDDYVLHEGKTSCKWYYGCLNKWWKETCNADKTSK